MLKRVMLTVLFAGLCLGADAMARQSDTAGGTPEAEQQLSREEIRLRMREAEERLAEAAAQIAELSERNLSEAGLTRFEFAGTRARPRLGISIDGGDDDVAVEGVTIAAVTPDSAAADAGLRAGDVITAINDESLGAPDAEIANGRLLEFMATVEEGDTLKVEYLRDGKVGRVEVEPRLPHGKNAFVWRFDNEGPPPGFIEREFDVHVAPGLRKEFIYDYSFGLVGSTWGSLELVELTEGLGRYFGTDKGLLVVSAPKDESIQLEDGDVIRAIDGREPESVSHAMRILASYQPGEAMELEIMRDKRQRTLRVTMPDKRRGSLSPPPPAPLPPLAEPARLAPPASTPLVVTGRIRS